MPLPRRTSVTLLLLIGLCGAVTGGAENACLEVLGRDPAGPSLAAAAGGGLAVWGLGSSLVVSDVSIPGQPRDVGSLMLPFAVTHVIVAGDRAVAAAGSALYEVDLGDPNRPRLLAALDLGDRIRGLSGSGDIAVAVVGSFTARVVSLAVRGEPIAAGTYFIPGDRDSIRAIAVVGRRAYITVSSSPHELRVIDFTTLVAPRLVASLPLPTYPERLAAAGTMVVAGSSSDLTVIDVAVPAAPVVRGSFAGRALGPLTIRDDGRLVYVKSEAQVGIESHSFLTTVDLANPASPRTVAEVDIEPGLPSALATAGGVLLAAGGSTGRLVVDARQTGSLALVADLAGVRTTARRVAASGTVVAVTGWDEEVRILTVDGAGRPIEVARMSFEAAGLDIEGDILVVAGKRGFDYGLFIYSLADPAHPEPVGELPLTYSERPMDVTVRNGFAYMLAAGLLYVVDVDDPADPVLVGQGAGLGGLRVQASDGWVYTVDFWGHMGCANVADPVMPVVTTTPDFAGNTMDLAVAPPWLYTADVGRELRVYTLADPSRPEFTKKLPVSGRGVSLLRTDEMLLLGESEVGLRGFDVDDPAHPLAAELGVVPISAEVYPHPSGMATLDSAVGPLVVVAGGDAGISVVSTSGCDPQATTILLPAAAAGPGANDSVWKTDLEIANLKPGELRVQLRYLPRSGDNSAVPYSNPKPIPEGTSFRIADVWESCCGTGGGAIELRLADPSAAAVVSRTYNTTPGGTFGQDLPGVASEDLLRDGDRTRLIQLSESASFRTNLGFANATDLATEVAVDFHLADGTALGSDTLTLQPRGVEQWNRAFRRVTSTRVDDGFIDVRPLTAGAAVAVFASVVDNRTSDPTTILSRPPGGLLVPAAAAGPGLAGSQWSTDLEVANLSDHTVSYRFRVLPRRADNSDAQVSEPFTLAAGAAVRYEDIWRELAGEGGGAIEVVTDEPEALMVMSRTINSGIDGTFGQGIPGIAEGELIVTGEVATLPLLTQTGTFRSNLAFVNAGDSPVTVEVEFFKRDGVRLGQDQISLGPRGNALWSEAFRRVTGDNVAAGFVRVRTTTPDARFFAFASVIDNRTGDPTTVLPG